MKDSTFASSSLPRHLVRGLIGFGSFVAAFALLPYVGPASLLLAPVGLVALRGCPTCWMIGLAATVSRGRLQRSCVDGQCRLTTSASPATTSRSLGDVTGELGEAAAEPSGSGRSVLRLPG